MTKDKRSCACGELINIESLVCPKCGRKHHQLEAEPGSFEIEGYPPAIIIEGKDPETDEFRIKVDSPGARSVSRERKSGDLAFLVEGAEAGRQSEPWALKTLLNVLREQGHNVDVLESMDARGEDSIYQIGNNKFVVQVTTAPTDSEFWRGASRSTMERESAIEQVVLWFRQALENKSENLSRNLRSQTILVIDTRHAGTLATERLSTRYLSQFRDPTSEFGFASVWIVGPTKKRCIRLGDGYP